MQPARILIVEDDKSHASNLKYLLESEGYGTEVATTLKEGLAHISNGVFDVVVTDLNLRGSGDLNATEGLDIIRWVHREKPKVSVILITGEPSTETNIEAMKLGAFDYIPKDHTSRAIEPQQFLPLIEKAVAKSRFLAGVTEVPRIILGEEQKIVGNSAGMRAVYKQIGQIAATPTTVLIRGETGTGKELVAHAVHQHSDLADNPFVVVNCPAIPPDLLASELFGHEPEAYTGAKTRRFGQFEQANGGTIFLDEIGDMPENAQTQLLRVLQNKTIQRLGGKETISVDVRIIAATHRDLELAMVEKEFREDLYHRINVAVIHLPPLRDRREDIPELVKHFSEKSAAELGWGKPTIDPEAVEFLQQQSWPGNVRELQHVVHRAVLFGRGTSISLENVRESLLRKPSIPADTNTTLAARVSELLAKAKRGELQGIHELLASEVERELYGQAIQLANGDQTRAAAWLGVSRPTMREKLTRHGLYPGRDAG